MVLGQRGVGWRFRPWGYSGRLRTQRKQEDVGADINQGTEKQQTKHSGKDGTLLQLERGIDENARSCVDLRRKA